MGEMANPGSSRTEMVMVILCHFVLIAVRTIKLQHSWQCCSCWQIKLGLACLLNHLLCRNMFDCTVFELCIFCFLVTCLGIFVFSALVLMSGCLEGNSACENNTPLMFWEYYALHHQSGGMK